MDEEYFNKIPVWSADDKRFEVLGDEISGRIPVAKLDRWQDFSELLESDFFNQPGTQLIYRGHRRYDWNLTPSLGRLSASGIVTEEMANSQIDLFRRAVRGRLNDTSLVEDGQEDELWSVGQHHGLMSPLLDWTYSPYVALFFAFAKEDKIVEELENYYRSIYVLNKSFVSDDGLCPDIRVLEPRKDEHGRLVNQAGLFTFSPYDATIENNLINVLSSDDFDELKDVDEEKEAEVIAKYICKIYIKNEDREGCLRHLRRMNVHHASLFPDLLGASDYCNILIEEEERQKAILAEREAEEKEKEAPKEIVVEEGEEAPVDEEKAKGLATLLNSPEESRQVEPGRIGVIVNELNSELRKHTAVDWEDRENIQARLRNIVRVILRKYGYPASARDAIIDEVLKVALSKDTPSD